MNNFFNVFCLAMSTNVKKNHPGMVYQIQSLLLHRSGLEPEIQKLLSKHKQELKKLRALHEAELLQADERAAQRFVHQCEELRQQLEREKEEECQRERELAKQR